MMLFTTRFAMVLWLLVPAIFQAQGLEHLEQYTLNNGLTVILNEDHNRSEVFGYMVCKAGSKDDPEDATGMAHYMEHLLFKGTETMGTIDWEKEKPHIDSIFVLYDKLGQTNDEKQRKEIQKLINEQSVKANQYAIPNELDNILKQMGGTQMNANTSPDRTVYLNTFPPNQMEKWLTVYSHRFQSPVFRSFQAELEVVYEEKNMGSDSFFNNIFERFLKEAFKKHPYGQQSTIGTIDHLKNPSLTKMKEFFDRWYAPNNMALILSGDFDSEMVKPMIEKAFMSWKQKEIPEHGHWEEEPFNGRELVEVRMSPVKIGVLAFRTVPENHPDYLALTLCNNLLSNESGSGFLNQLSTDHELLTAEAFPLPFYDHGLSIILFLPKIVGQSLDDAEKLVLAKVDSLKAGKFEDWRVGAMKKELYRSHLESMESNDYRAMLIGEAWAQGDDPSELKNYTTKINKVTKEDVIAVANKYYGDNYLAFYSKMGSFKGEKIEKPDYEPVVSNTNARSEFNQSLDGIGESEFAPRFIDFDKDVTMSQLKDGVKLYRCENPMNDIFSLDIRFNAGKEEIPMLEYVIPIMDMAYTEEYSKKAIKDEMSRIAASYYFEFDESYTHLHVTGIEGDLERALDLMNELLTNPQMDDKEIETLVDYIKGDRKFENAEPYDVAQAAMEYVKYGSESDYLDRLTMKEIKALEIQSLINEFKKLQGYSVELHYVGKRPMKDLKKVLSEHLQFGDNLKETDVPVIKPVKVYNDNEVFFVHKKNAVQSQVMFMQNGKLITLDDVPSIQAFNSYFGGGFSGLVLQEIREYRSLAYSAAAWTDIPDRLDVPNSFKGYIGTQADKTDDAISTFMDLVRNMPDKEDRMDMIRSYLKYSAISYQPEFRRIIPYVIEKKKQGYPEVPAKYFQDVYPAITYGDIRTYYEKNIQNTPTVVVVVGDKKKVDVEGLKKYGTLTSLKEDQLYSE